METENRKKGIKKTVLAVLGAIIILAVLVTSSITIIPTGYTGVRTTFGQISEHTVSSGFNLKLPFVQNIEVVNNKQQDIIFSNQIWSETSERTAIYYDDVTVTYQINPQKSAWIYANVSNYQNNLVSQSLVASGIKATSKALSDEDATNRSVIEPSALEKIQHALDDKYGENVVIVNKVVIGNADFDESYNAAIAAKQKAILEAQQQKIENQKAIEKAQAQATVTRTTAEAEAEAKVIAAQAEADANKLLEESLSDKVLRDKYLDKWDGSLPKVVGSGSTDIMIGMNDLSEAEVETEKE